MTFLTAALGTVETSWSNCTTAKAMCPSEEIWWQAASKGLRTPDTWARPDS